MAGESPHDRVTFCRPQVYERVVILPVEVYERVGKGNLSFRFGKSPKGLTDAFYGCEKIEKTF